MTILASYPFRVTRNSDLYVDEEGADDLLDAGIQKDQIVLGFQPPDIRPYTEFAVA